METGGRKRLNKQKFSAPASKKREKCRGWWKPVSLRKEERKKERDRERQRARERERQTDRQTD